MLKLDVGVVTGFLSDVLPGRDCGLSKKWHCSKYFVFLVNFKTVKILRQCFSPLGGWRGTGGARGPSGRSCYCWPQRKPLGNDTLTLSLSPNGWIVIFMIGLFYLNLSICQCQRCILVAVLVTSSSQYHGNIQLWLQIKGERFLTVGTNS